MWVIEQLKDDGTSYSKLRFVKERYYATCLTSGWACVSVLFARKKDALEVLRNYQEHGDHKYRIRRVILEEV